MYKTEYIVKLSNRNAWKEPFDEIGAELNDPITIKIEVDDKHQLHNIIYYYMLYERLKKHKENLKLEIHLCNDVNSNNATINEISQLLYFFNESKIKFFSQEKQIDNSKIRRTVNFKKTLPILILKKDHLIELKQVINLKNSSDEYNANDADYGPTDFMKTFIKKTSKECFKEEIAASSSELNLLTLFVYCYMLRLDYDNNKTDGLSSLQCQDLKQVLKNFSIGLLQIIENSCIHSKGEKAFVFFSELTFISKMTDSKEPKTYFEKLSDIIDKQKSFINNFYYKLDSSKDYMFVRIIDDARELKPIQRIGIIENYNQSNQSEFENLKDFFDAFMSENDLRIMENSSSKFGLITFLKSMDILKGQFVCSSSDHKPILYCNEYKSKNSIFNIEVAHNCNLTEYDCVIPIEAISSKKSQQKNIQKTIILSDVEYEVTSLYTTYLENFCFGENLNFKKRKNLQKTLSEGVKEIFVLESTADCYKEIIASPNVIYKIDIKPNFNLEILTRVLLRIVQICCQKKLILIDLIEMIDNYKISEDQFKELYNIILVIYPKETYPKISSSLKVIYEYYINFDKYRNSYESVFLISDSEFDLVKLIKNKENELEDFRNMVKNINNENVSTNDQFILKILHANDELLKAVEVLADYSVNYSEHKKDSFYVSLNFSENFKNPYYAISEICQYLNAFNKKFIHNIPKDDKKSFDLQIAFFINENDYLTTMQGIEWGNMAYTFINNLLYNNEFNETKNDVFKLYLDELSDESYDENVKPLVPFDFYNKKGGNLFLEKIRNILDEPSILHKKANTLLGSQIFIENFYEAEHLFRNYHIAQRLALMIWKEIKDDIKNDINYKELVIVGYANYSHFICECLKNFYNHASKKTAEIIYVPNNKIVNENIFSSNSEQLENKYCISIVLIGSTLKTFISMNNYLRQLFGIEDDIYLFKKAFVY